MHSGKSMRHLQQWKRFSFPAADDTSAPAGSVALISGVGNDGSSTKLFRCLRRGTRRRIIIYFNWMELSETVSKYTNSPPAVETPNWNITENGSLNSIQLKYMNIRSTCSVVLQGVLHGDQKKANDQKGHGDLKRARRSKRGARVLTGSHGFPLVVISGVHFRARPPQVRGLGRSPEVLISGVHFRARSPQVRGFGARAPLGTQ